MTNKETGDPVDIAKENYTELTTRETQYRNHRRILVALPKNKKKKYEALLAIALKNYRNAQSMFQKSVKKLTTEQFRSLRLATYV